MVNERLASSSLPEVPPHTLSNYDIQVKEETFNLFHREGTPSPVIFQNNNMKKELEDYDPNLVLLEPPPEDESDEETIATFITAAGQQLALYAVEDSDEIFAVAVYDESGEPPSDFQFLMRDDVEKLIGEGAVRTVKKTSQFKKQIYAMEEIPPPVPASPEPPAETPTPQKEEIIEFRSPQKCVKKEIPFSDEEDENPPENDYKSTLNIEENLPNSELYESWPSDNVYLVVQDNSMIETQGEPESKQRTPVKEEIKTKVIEKVQYILSDEPPPDPSDLTLADIEKILKQDQAIPRSSKSSLSRGVKSESLNAVGIDLEVEPIDDQDVSEEHNFSQDNENLSQDNESFPQDDTFTKLNSSEVLRIKRPRKQQLTTVNRADSEIIIQPAMMTEVDEENLYQNRWKVQPKKRGRRKKKKDTTMKKTPYMRTRRKTSKPRKKKKYRIEVIDIDLEDVNREIITLEDGKEKGSSDKENDVIMVGDSDDDEDKEEEVEVDDSDDSDYDDGAERRGRRGTRRRLVEILKCQRCRREFRGKRGLEMHSRMCSKGGKAQGTISERTRSGTRRTAPMRSARLKSVNEGNTRDKGRGKKEYKCKSCHERFEVVVALARHVKLMHSLRKKINTIRKEEKKVSQERLREGRRTRSLGRKDEVEKKVERGKRRERFRKVKRGRIWRNAGTKRINCLDCRRSFPSLAAMLAHSLQHATKKIVSEKMKVQRCRRCKKVFRSKYLYIRHLRSHSSIPTLQKRKSRITKQSANTPIKKRGRPQKS
ncbi:myoneurin [Diachasma alloeum]|uniref:myoneurin n=1 Tax=Diachasma alloeum TaxID=454923 RepID=UPI0007381DF0|nr:myoneurin [Diachasma alloeum]XP_015116218.1 myoneurin [Diachasma alloeum]